MNKEQIVQQMAYVLRETDFDFIGKKYEGKVRDSYVRDGVRYLVTTDRLSCFDVVVTHIPFKGQVLSELANYWFKLTEDIISNHIIQTPDPNVMVAKECDVLPVEVVMRGYLAGSAWRDYEAGKEISGIRLEPGLKMHQKLPMPILTPSTKAEKGDHDRPIGREELLDGGLVTPERWAEVEEVAHALFQRGTEKAAEQGLILVDTKYEFGLLDSELILVDEIHTLDSSRYWVEETYQAAFESSEPPEMLDKEPVRRWLMSQGYMGDGPIPEFGQDYVVELAKHYIDSYKRITGNEIMLFPGDVTKRVENNLRDYLDALG